MFSAHPEPAHREDPSYRRFLRCVRRFGHHRGAKDKGPLSAVALARDPASTLGQRTSATTTARPSKWFATCRQRVVRPPTINSNRPKPRDHLSRSSTSRNAFNSRPERVVQIAASKPNDAGCRVDFAARNSIPQITKTQDQNAAQFDLQQAFASYIAPLGSGLRFDVGKFVTHMGYELIEGYDGYNDNYSRSILFGYAFVRPHRPEGDLRFQQGAE